jgi:hypothetical protein
MINELAVEETPRGWIAYSPDGGLAARGESAEDARRELLNTLQLVERLAAMWSPGENERDAQES